MKESNKVLPQVKSTPIKSRRKKNKAVKLTNAQPPLNYVGSIDEWMATLKLKGLWNGQGRYEDVLIPTDDWWDVLIECEYNISLE